MFDLSPLLQLVAFGGVLALGPLAWVWWRVLVNLSMALRKRVGCAVTGSAPL